MANLAILVQVGDTGPALSPNSLGKTVVEMARAAFLRALLATEHAPLAEVVAAWFDLSDDHRNRILTVVRAAVSPSTSTLDH